MKTEILPSPTILLADDNPPMLELFVDLLKQEYRVVAAVLKGACVLDQIATLNPDVVVLDVSLGDLCGFEVARRLRDRGYTTKIIFLTVHEGIDFVSEGFNLGGSGYVFKSRAVEDLKKAIDIVLSGGRFCSKSLQN